MSTSRRRFANTSFRRRGPRGGRGLSRSQEEGSHCRGGELGARTGWPAGSYVHPAQTAGLFLHREQGPVDTRLTAGTGCAPERGGRARGERRTRRQLWEVPGQREWRQRKRRGWGGPGGRWAPTAGSAGPGGLTLLERPSRGSCTGLSLKPRHPRHQNVSESK